MGYENWDTDCPGYEFLGGTLFLSAHCLSGVRPAEHRVCQWRLLAFKEKLIQPQQIFFHFFPSLSRKRPVTLSCHPDIFPTWPISSHLPAGLCCLNRLCPLWCWLNYLSQSINQTNSSSRWICNVTLTTYSSSRWICSQSNISTAVCIWQFNFWHFREITTCVCVRVCLFVCLKAKFSAIAWQSDGAQMDFRNMFCSKRVYHSSVNCFSVNRQ